MEARTAQKQALMIAEVSREDAASRSLLERDPAVWFFLNLLMSNIRRMNEHLEQLHDDLEKVNSSLATANLNTEALIYSIGTRD